jgi:hypothetical protein
MTSWTPDAEAELLRELDFEPWLECETCATDGERVRGRFAVTVTCCGRATRVMCAGCHTELLKRGALCMACGEHLTRKSALWPRLVSTEQL